MWENFRLSARLHLSAQLAEQLYAQIAEIDAIKHTFNLTQVLLPEITARLTQSVIVTSTGASNRIEGNQLTDQEVEDLYQSMRIKSFKTRDEQEVAGYLEVLQMIFENHDQIQVSESGILHLHHRMLSHSAKDQHHKGRYKLGSNRVEAKDQSGNLLGVIFNPTPPHLTPKEVQELVQWYQWAIDVKFKHPLILIGNFIFEYLAIHPFQDGNGRTSRLLTNLMLLQHGYRFASLVSHEKQIEQTKANYYLALNKTQQSWKSESEDMTHWLVYLFDVFLEQAKQAQTLLTEDQFELLLSEKQLLFWKWAYQQQNFSRKTAIEALGFSPRTIEDITKKFLSMKKIERLGQGRATRYRVL